MKKICFYIALLFTLSHTGFAKESFFYAPEDHAQIAVNNRILAKVNGKAISVFDVMKKMDMLFYRQFPEYTSSTQARFQFYQVNWKKVLEDLIDKELIMADAEESKIKVSAGDVRQEMEQMFGSNIHTALDQIGVSFEEAYKMVYSDIVLKRMLYVRANVKALREVTPQVIRSAYQDYAKTHIRPQTWTYMIISLRDKDVTKAAEAAHQAYRLLTEDRLPIQDLKATLESLASISSSTGINISQELTQEEKELSQSNKNILSQLAVGTFSEPTKQKSRQDGGQVFRILFLKQMTPESVVPFDQVANELKEDLLQKASSKETQLYLKKLHKHFDVQENLELGENFQPFSIV